MALDFGSSANAYYVNCGNPNSWNWAAGPGTLLAWFWSNAVGTASEFPVIISKSDGSNNLRFFQAWQNQDRLEFGIGGTNALGARSVDGTLVANAWQFVAVTWEQGAGDSAQQLWKGDRNTPVAEVSYVLQSDGSGLHDSTSIDLLIGINTTSPNGELDGKVALVAGWDGVRLSLEELIIAQFKPWLIPTIQGANLEFFLQLGIHGANGVGTQKDWSGQGYDGTVTSATKSDHVPLAIFPYRIVVPAFPSVAGALQINVSDSIAVGESTILDPLVLPDLSETEALTIGETADLYLTLDLPAQSDALTIGDTATLDPVFPTEIVEVDGLTVGDTATVQIPVAGLLTVSVSDGLTVGEAATLTPIVIPDLSETEALTVGDSASVDPVSPTEIDASDSVAVGDSATVQIPAAGVIQINVADGITVGETVTMAPVTAIEITETDGLAVGDTATITPIVIPGINVSDSLVVGDSAAVATTAITFYAISVSDDLAVGEVVSLDPITIPTIAVSDGVVVGESVSVGYFVVVIDTVDLVMDPWTYRRDPIPEGTEPDDTPDPIAKGTDPLTEDDDVTPWP